MDLLQGRFDEGAMRRLTERDRGLFPQPREIAMRCSCPDSARLCKHLAAVLYGVGARLDKVPELLFTLRDVDHLELISAAVDADNLDQSLAGRAEAPLANSDLGEIFGIDLEVNGAGKAEGIKTVAAPASGGDEIALPRAQRKPSKTVGAKKKPLNQSKPSSGSLKKQVVAAKPKSKRTRVPSHAR
jgi:uncharacterized Zn finger protein